MMFSTEDTVAMRHVMDFLDTVGDQPLPCTASGEDFYPTDKEYAAIETAKAICDTCPFEQACLTVALRNNEQYGIWGGTTPLERRTLIRRHRHA